jgi:probable rRNA maturation factor
MDALLTVDVERRSRLWRAVPGAASRVRRAARAAYHLHGGGAAASMAVALVGDRSMRGLNRRFRGVDKPTNVLSFPAPRPPQAAPVRHLGDVAIAIGVLLAEAAAEERDPAAHLDHLVVHGVLHLLGFDHDTPATATVMERAEVAILATLGVPDPYEGRALEPQAA